MAAKFELFKDKAGEFRWRLRHQNGNIIADSAEGYSTKAAAINGIESVKKNISLANVSDKTISRSTESPRVVAAQLTSDVAGEKVVRDQMSETRKKYSAGPIVAD
ncbi:MAG: HVO_2922 family protein [Dehalogenimonas sp.]